jgi:hypothetical protein
MIPTFLVCDCLSAHDLSEQGGHTALPEALAISVRLWKTDCTVRAFGLNMVGWLFLEF